MVLSTMLASAREGRVARLRSRLTQIITIAPVMGRDGYGKVTYGIPATHPARVEGKQQMIRTASGDERVSNRTVLLAGAVAVTLADKLTLPDGTTPPIIAIATTSGEAGDHSTILYT